MTHPDWRFRLWNAERGTPCLPHSIVSTVGATLPGSIRQRGFSPSPKSFDLLLPRTGRRRFGLWPAEGETAEILCLHGAPRLGKLLSSHSKKCIAASLKPSFSVCSACRLFIQPARGVRSKDDALIPSRKASGPAHRRARRPRCVPRRSHISRSAAHGLCSRTTCARNPRRERNQVSRSRPCRDG